MADASDVTRILKRLTQGDTEAFSDLLPLVHDELRSIAQKHMRRARPGHTLQATALVNEAYLKMSGQGTHEWENRAHFLNAASRAMRHLLVNHARDKMRLKRGGSRLRESAETLDAIEAPGGLSLSELLSLDESLAKLEKLNPDKARAVELRYFGGLSLGETARVLGVTTRTVHRQERTGLAWLKREMGSAGDQTSAEAGGGTSEGGTL